MKKICGECKKRTGRFRYNYLCYPCYRKTKTIIYGLIPPEIAQQKERVVHTFLTNKTKELKCIVPLPQCYAYKKVRVIIVGSQDKEKV